MIPDEIVERVRDEADIVSIIGEFVKLKRVGNSFRGPCPFHHGKNANFSVRDRGYNCFVCHESGDVFSFVQKQLGLDFIDAVKWVGGKAGVEVHEVARRTEERDAREPLWEVNGTAADYFRTQLWESAEGKVARDYLASRAITRDDADRFGLGYAPRDAGAMRGALERLGFDEARQLSAGLLVTSDERPDPRARFRARLIFPIYDASNHVVGFGGRVLGVGEPKYLNSAESEVFSKRKLLYGLNWAKQAVRKAERLVIVEGYFDVIRLMLAGVNEVVAPLGTALTEDQAALVRKYTKEVFLLYDSDQAGLKATFRNGDELLKNGISVRVVTLPAGHDPDTFVAQAGAAGFERAASASVDVFERKIQILERNGWFGDLKHKRQALDKLLPTIRVTSDRLSRELYLNRAAEAAGVPASAIANELAIRNPSPTNDHREAQPTAADRRRGGDRRATSARPSTVLLERELIRILLRDSRLIEDVGEKVVATDFAEASCRHIFTELVAHPAETPISEWVDHLDESAAHLVEDLLDRNRDHYVKVDRPEAVAVASVNRFLARSYRRRAEQIDDVFALAPEDEKIDLAREKQILRRRLEDLGAGSWKTGRVSAF